MPDTDFPDPRPLRADLRSAAGGVGACRAGSLRPDVSGQRGGDLRAQPAGPDGLVPAAGNTDPTAGVVSGGWRRASGGGDSDGDTVRQARSRGDHAGLRFDIPVGPDGYAWWYVDGVSDDGRHAISIIAFIGSVFSPWYRWSGRKDPENHVCLNVATYGPGGRFTMTDRGRAALRRDAHSLSIGPSQMRWTGSELIVDIDEWGAPPLVTKVRGRVTLTPSAVTDIEVALTPDNRHLWRPFAPSGSIEVSLNGGVRWSGHGYFDANFGSRALETDFSTWTWGRFPVSDGAICLYDAKRRDGSNLSLGLHVSTAGLPTRLTPPPVAQLRRTPFLLARETRADPGYRPHQTMRLFEAPFYNRSLVRTKLFGEETVGMHEALDLRRFRHPLMKPLLAVRVPRRSGWSGQKD